jgi:glyoxylase-like metal-dependent hydrolase (beta-lactamase superfamily II)
MLMLGRREFLLAGLATPAWMSQKSDTAVLLDRGFARVYRFADDLYVTIADSEKGPQCLSNGGVIAGRTATLIVEGHFQPQGAELELEVARKVSNAPIRAAVNTHYHFDHTFGNSAYANQGIPIIAHDRTVSLMKDKYASLKNADKRPLVAAEEQKIARAVDAKDKAHRESDLALFKLMMDAIDATAITVPTETLSPFDLPRRIDLGSITAVIEYLPGHTGADVIVTCPERDIVFTGDLLFFRSYPVSIDADMIAWRRTLDRFAHYDRRTRFVPGHGQICGLEVVREQCDLFDDLHAHAAKMIRTGASVDEAERRYVLPKRFAAFDTHAWGWSIGAAMQSYYAALRKS